jgi:hypothetical protein
VDELKEAGRYHVVFDGVELSSGLYFFRLKTEQYAEVKKLMIVK